MKEVFLIECKTHGLSDHVLRKGGTNSYRCRKCSVEAVTKRRIQVKIMSIEYLGGKCCKCGYKKCIWALEFHHLDPKEKKFRLGDGFTRSWERVKKELDKCILVCANCHREIENGM